MFGNVIKIENNNNFFKHQSADTRFPGIHKVGRSQGERGAGARCRCEAVSTERKAYQKVFLACNEIKGELNRLNSSELCAYTGMRIC